jgi:hypothetical protein
VLQLFVSTICISVWSVLECIAIHALIFIISDGISRQGICLGLLK